MKTNRLGGTCLGIILSVLVILTLSGCAGNPSSQKEVVLPKPLPTVTLDAAPAATTEAPVSYGDTVKVTVTTKDAYTNGSTTVSFRPLKDTTVTVTVTGPGGSATGSRFIKVGSPTAKMLLLTSKAWFLKAIYVQLSDGSWKSTGGTLTTCLMTSAQNLYLDFTSSIEMRCNPGVPNATPVWGFREGETKLYWGGFIDPVTKAETLYTVKTLNENLMQLTQLVKNVSTGAFDMDMFEYTH